MAEYIEKQVAIKAVHAEFDECLVWDESGQYTANEVENVLEAIPPADVRPVVLCDKCRWFDNRGYPNQDPEMPELRMGHCHILGRDVQACWFCATGEREGGDAE